MAIARSSEILVSYHIITQHEKQKATTWIFITHHENLKSYMKCCCFLYEGVSESFQASCLEQELQMLQLSATRCNCITILWVSLVSFAAITLCIASQWVFVVLLFVCLFHYWISPETLDTPSYRETVEWRTAIALIRKCTFSRVYFQGEIAFFVNPLLLP
jgi:hypothetical protein